MPQSGRPIVGLETGGIGRATQGLGAALMSIGEAEEARRDDLEYARAKSEFLKAKVEVDNTIDQEPDFQTWGQTYQERLDKALENSADMISSSRLRERFKLDVAPSIEAGFQRVASKARQREAEVGLADVNQRLNENRQAALAAQDDVSRQELIQASRTLIDGAVERGYIDPVQAQTLKRQWTQDYALGLVEMQPPAKRLEMIPMREDGTPSPEKTGTPVDFIPLDVRARIVRQAQNELKQQNTRQRKAVLEDYKDYVAYLRAGNVPTGRYTPEKLRQTFGDDAEPLVEELERAEQFGNAYARIATASPDEVANILADAAKALETPEDYRAASSDFDALQKALAQRNKALIEDPAQYVFAHNEDVQASYEAMTGVMANPAATTEDRRAAAEAYATAALAEQERLGLSPEQTRLLPKAYAKSVAAQFFRQDEGGQNAAQLITALEDQWGRYWPQVYGELSKDLPPVALVIGSGIPEPAAIMLAEAANLKVSDILTDKTVVNDLRTELSTALTEFKQTVIGVPGGVRTFNVFSEGIEKLAALYAAQGMTPQDAVTKAYEEVLGAKYEFFETYRVPVEYDSDLVSRGALDMLRNIGEMNLEVPQSLFGLPEDDARRAYVNALQDQAYWMTAPDESGLVLYANGAAVTLDDGSPLIVRWEDLMETGEGAAAADPVSQRDERLRQEMRDLQGKIQRQLRQ